MPPENEPPRLELWSGRIPYIGRFAHHYWFVVEQEGRRDRWEVWQTRSIAPTSWGYLHKNLMAPDIWIKGQPHERIREWRGAGVAEIIGRIEDSPNSYPWLYRYHYWPGPNSNTWVQWILEDWHLLGTNAIGRRYAQCRAGRKRSRSSGH